MGGGGIVGLVFLGFIILVIATPIVILCSTKRAPLATRLSYALSSFLLPLVAVLLLPILLKGTPNWLRAPAMLFAMLSPYLIRSYFVFKHPEMP
jgi:hypothetical protein